MDTLFLAKQQQLLLKHKNAQISALKVGYCYYHFRSYTAQVNNKYASCIVLKQGGNAVDAAIASGLCIGVIDSFATGKMTNGVFLIHDC